MNGIEEAIVTAVRGAVQEALAEQKYAYSYAEAAARLGCSDRAVRRMVNDGLLDLVPYANAKITAGSLRRLVGLDPASPDGLRLVDSEVPQAP